MPLIRRVTPKMAPAVRREQTLMTQSATATRPLQYGSRGPAVAALQRHLKAVGLYKRSTNGIYGANTRAAVIALQRSKQLPATGKVGPKEVAAVKGLDLFVKPGFATPARPGQVGSDVKDMENRLRRLGFNVGAVDGVYDARTKAAVHSFQVRNGLARSGLIGPATYRRIVAERNQQVASMSTRTVAGCARLLLASKNVRFWSGLSTGSDRKALVALAAGRRAYVPATGGYVTPNLRLMQSLVEMSRRGPIMINALTGGAHSSNSRHYRGMAVDLDVSTGNAGMIESVARRHGGSRNWERTHIHLDF